MTDPTSLSRRDLMKIAGAAPLAAQTSSSSAAFPDVIVARAARLLEQPGALLGFDAPIGLPEAYARARRVGAFGHFLASLAADDPFLEPVAPPDRPSLEQPFYPRRPGGATVSCRRRRARQAPSFPGRAILASP